ncbi:putative glycolipid-binding domain-containing protein [Ascidiimonas aurantiaca]|uniref:putative glycolipid-binding domain-containing protein n=1 Tax=Ascidiimonas aurantiaca TaxID=1685432 RepID=UPI0030EF9EFB
MSIEKEKIIIWRRDDESSTSETLQFKKYGKGFIVKSTVNGILESQPILMEYQIIINRDWVVKEVEIKSLLGELNKITLKSDLNGKWYDVENQEISELNGCIDIDISITPFTNTLPIKRLGNSLEQRTKITVLYFDIKNWEYKKVKQYYTKLTDNLYKYEGVFRNFVADIPIDNSGFVTTYPKLFKRLYPKNE